jgi:predicted thioesterase
VVSLPRSRRVYQMRHGVTDNDTAAALGSGDVPVLATPRLIAWMEAATVRAVTAFLNVHVAHTLWPSKTG